MSIMKEYFTRYKNNLDKSQEPEPIKELSLEFAEEAYKSARDNIPTINIHRMIVEAKFLETVALQIKEDALTTRYAYKNLNWQITSFANDFQDNTIFVRVATVDRTCVATFKYKGRVINNYEP